MSKDTFGALAFWAIMACIGAVPLLGACAPVTPVTPYADAVPMPMQQPFNCNMVGSETGFDLLCTDAPVPTPLPSFHYLFCEVGDSLCWGTPWRIWWDMEQKYLRCAIDVTTATNGSKVTVLATIDAGPNGKPLSWVRTGFPSGAAVCEGWIESDRVLAAE